MHGWSHTLLPEQAQYMLREAASIEDALTRQRAVYEVTLTLIKIYPGYYRGEAKALSPLVQRPEHQTSETGNGNG